MNFIIIIALLIAAYYAFKFWKRKKTDQQRQEMFESLSDSYNYAIGNGDINSIKSTARELVNYPFVPQSALNTVYEQSLSLLKSNPDLKPFVLEMGRKKYAHFRENGSPTVYDESAILNDITAAS